MAFNPKTDLKPQIYEQYKLGPLAWPAVVKTAVELNDPDKKYRDVDWLASVVFYLHHPERNGRKIDPGETAMIAEWKNWRTLIKPMVPAMAATKPESPGSATPAAKWELDAVEAWEIQKTWGKEIIDWVKIPPEGKAAKEFSPPPSMRGDYKTVFVWKSLDAKKDCPLMSQPYKRVQIVALLRDDKAYWDARTKGNRIQTDMLQTAAATAIRDYRDYIVNRKFCPPAAFNRLVQVNKDVIYEMFLGMFQLLSPHPASPMPGNLKAFGKFDLGNPHASGVTSVPEAIKMLIEELEKI